jgi:hypothetical protein
MISVPQPTHKLARKFNTPQILRNSWYTTWGVSLLLLMISVYGVAAQRKAIENVGKNAAPSIITAQQLQDSFADLDASLANELLLKPGNIDRQVLAAFELNRKKIAERLVAAAKNITYPEEKKIVESLQFNFSAYLLRLQEARDTHKRGDAASTLAIYQNAAQLMDREIIPQAEKLGQVNAQELEKSFNRQNFTNGGIAFAIAIVGLTQIGIICAIQLFLYLRMRRILNIPLLGATAISIIFLGYTLSSFIGASANLRTAKSDAFDSVYALRKMRSLSYKANADESRYLLDRANSAKHEQSYNDKVTRILNIPADRSIESIISNVSQKKPTSGLTGLFADGLNNITFAGERELAIETLKAWNDYLKIDTQIRQLYRSGKVAEAIALCIGTKPGESNWAFDRYKNIHTKLMDLNKQEFEQNIKRGQERLDNFEIIAAVALSSVAILTLFGLRPRLMEYR